MVRILSRSIALVFAVALVWAAGITLTNSVALSRSVTFIGCLCFPTVQPGWEDVYGWKRQDAGVFTVQVPSGTDFRILDDFAGSQGRIVHPAFGLTWHYDTTVDDGSALRNLAAYSEERLMLDGREAVIRRAVDPQSANPYRLVLYIARADARGSGMKSLALEGAFPTPERRDMAEQVVRSVIFQQVPRRPPIDPPTIVIDYPSAKETP